MARAAGCHGRRECRAHGAARTSSSSRSARRPGCAPRTPSCAARSTGPGRASAVAAAAPQRDVRTFALTDLVWARAARGGRPRAIAEHDPRAIVYSTITAALLWPAPGAIRFDAPAAANRPGPPRDLAAPARAAAPAQPRRCSSRGPTARWPRRPRRTRRAVVVPIPVEPSSDAARRRRARHRGAHLRARTRTRRASTGCSRAWVAARREGEELVVAGTEHVPGHPRRAQRRTPARPTTTARSCAGRASSSPRRAARTTGSPSSRRSPTAARS